MNALRLFLSLAMMSAIVSACSMGSSSPPVFSEDKHVGAYKIGSPYQIDGTWYTPQVDESYEEEGVASWYGPGFHKKLTANGDKFDQHALTAAHRTLPMPSMVRVTNLDNGRSLVVMVNDRGPFSKGRILDLSERAADILGFKDKGLANVRVKFLPGQTRRLLSQLDVPSGKGNPFATNDPNFGMPEHLPVASQEGDLPLPPNFNISNFDAAEAQPDMAYDAEETQIAQLDDAPIGLENPFARQAQPMEAPADTYPMMAPPLGANPQMMMQMPEENAVVEAESVIVVEPEEVVVEADVDVVNAQEASDAEETTLVIPDNKVLLDKDDPRYVNEYYFIQVGSYRLKDNAVRAERILTPLGEKVHIEDVGVIEGEVSRVKLGPIYKEARAKQLLKHVTEMGYPDAIIVGD